MNVTKSRIHNPHEKWCTQFALPLCGPVRAHRVFRQHLVVDATLFMAQPVSLWGPLAEHLARREVLVEHFSNSVSVEKFANCLEKIAFALKVFASVPIKNRGEKRSPCLVILAHQRPDRLLREPGLFEEMETPGIYLRRPLELGPVFLVVPPRLPPGREFDWLRTTTRVPETTEEIQRAKSLLNDPKIDSITREQMEKTMFELVLGEERAAEYRAELRAEVRAELWAEVREEVAAEFEALRNIAEEQKRAAEEQKRAAEEQKRAAEEQKRAAEEQKRAAEEELEELRKQLKELKKGQ